MHAKIKTTDVDSVSANDAEIVGESEALEQAHEIAEKKRANNLKVHENKITIFRLYFDASLSTLLLIVGSVLFLLISVACLTHLIFPDFFGMSNESFNSLETIWFHLIGAIVGGLVTMFVSKK